MNIERIAEIEPDDETLHRDCITDQDARLVRCPDCGQMEWWSEAELIDHGRCRAGLYPCPCNE